MKRARLLVIGATIVASALSSPSHPFIATELRVGRDSFDLVLRSSEGLQTGVLVQTVARVDDTYRITVQNDIGNSVRQFSEVTIDAGNLAPMFHREAISLRGRGAIVGELQFLNGIASGAYASLDPRTEAIKVPVDRDVIDDEVSTALLPTLPLADGYATSFRSFVNPGVVQTTKVWVAGRDTVQVPAGSFATFRLHVEAPRDTSDIFITEAKPRRVVLVRLPRGGGSMRLVK